MENHSQNIKDVLKPGDLLFQLSIGGEREWLISRLFEGVNGQALNHVAIYIGSNRVIEAVSPEVKKTPLNSFIKKSVVDLKGKPCVTISRLLPAYGHLIPAAIAFAEGCVSHPYDHSYGSQSGWFCSQLVLEAFRYANKGKPVFQQTPMSFRDPETGELFSYWIELYKRLGLSVPEGQAGSHPALVSLSNTLKVIKVIGYLSYKKLNNFIIPPACLMA